MGSPSSSSTGTVRIIHVNAFSPCGLQHVELFSVVVDNGSTDRRGDLLIEESGLADILLRTGTNLGYVGATTWGSGMRWDPASTT